MPRAQSTARAPRAPLRDVRTRSRKESTKFRPQLVSESVGLLMHPTRRRVVMITAAGAVYARPGRIGGLPPAAAWRYIQDLHFRTTGERDRARSDSLWRLSSRRAFYSYSNALAMSLMQITLVGRRAHRRVLSSLCEFAFRHGSIEGIESLYLTSIIAAIRDGDQRLARSAAEILTTIERPRQLGGGVKTAPVLDPSSGRITFLDEIGIGDLLNTIGGGSLGGLDGLFPGGGLNPIGGGFGGLNITGPGVAADGFSDWFGMCSNSITISTGVGASIGTGVGAAGGPGGMAGGAGVGAGLGATFGVGMCIGEAIGIWLDDKDENHPGGDSGDAGTPEPAPEPDGGGDGGGDSGSGGSSGGDEGGSSGGGDEGGSSGGGDEGGSSAGDEGSGGMCIDPGHSGGDMPNPEGDPGDDGQEGGGSGPMVGPTMFGTGNGIGGLVGQVGPTSFSLQGLPSFGDDGRLVSPGILLDPFVNPASGEGYNSDDQGSRAAGGIGRAASGMLPRIPYAVDPSPIELGTATRLMGF